MRANDEEEDESSDEEIRPGAVAVAGPGAAAMARSFRSRTSPSVLNESQGPSAIDEQSTIMGELLEPSQQLAVTGIGIVENVENRKGIGFFVGAVFALVLLVVGVILGVTIPLTSNTNKEIPSPTAAPTACPSLDCLLAEILLQNEVLDAEALQDESSPQFLALRWLANNDAVVLDLDSMPHAILVERYVLAVLYFAARKESGFKIYSASSVCEWPGILCNQDDLVVALLLGKSKHAEVFVLISKFCIDSPFYFPFRIRWGDFL
jgi:hypothetical protein